MSSSSSKPATSTGHEPVDDFAECHAGIVAHLSALRELPTLLQPAAHARRLASETLTFFRPVVYAHHQEEERDLFTAVHASALAGAERQQVQALMDRLTAEHRQIEAAWEVLEPSLKAIAHGRDAEVDNTALVKLVDTYLAHAAFEEREFLPLSRQILGRNGDHMAALGLSMHARRVLPDWLQRYGARG